MRRFTLEANKKQGVITPVVAWFLAAMILSNIPGRMVFVLLGVYIADGLGATIGQIGLVFTLASIVPMALQILGGWLSDALGRLPTIAIGSGFGVAGYLGFVFAPSWGWMAAALMLHNVASSLVGPSFGAFIADQTTEENRGRVFGLVDTLYQVVGVVGPPLGGFLAFTFGFKTVLVTAAILYTLATILRIWMAVSIRFKEKEAGEVGEKLTLKNLKTNLLKMLALVTAGGVLTWIMVTDGVIDVSFRLSTEMNPLFLSQIGGMNAQQIGWVSAVFSITVMALSLPGGWVADKLSERFGIIVGFLLEFFAILVFVNARSFAGFAIYSVLMGAGIALVNPAYNTLVSKVVPHSLRGVAYGLFYTSVSILALPFPYIGAWLWERFSPQTPYILTAAGILLSILPVWFMFKLSGVSLEESHPDPTPAD